MRGAHNGSLGIAKALARHGTAGAFCPSLSPAMKRQSSRAAMAAWGSGDLGRRPVRAVLLLLLQHGVQDGNDPVLEQRSG